MAARSEKGRSRRSSAGGGFRPTIPGPRRPRRAAVAAPVPGRPRRPAFGEGVLEGEGCSGLKASFGDTPSLSLVDDWSGLDEVRPGNFRLLRSSAGGDRVLRPEDIAAAVACPVFGVYPGRSEAVVYCGAVHLSKQSQLLANGNSVYGAVFRAEGERWRDFLPGAWVKSVTQEHGIVHLEPEDLGRLRIGDLLVLCPVHSCLAADLLRSETVLL